WILIACGISWGGCANGCSKATPLRPACAPRRGRRGADAGARDLLRGKARRARLGCYGQLAGISRRVEGGRCDDVDGREISSRADLIRALGAATNGQEMTIGIVRDKKE